MKTRLFPMYKLVLLTVLSLSVLPSAFASNITVGFSPSGAALHNVLDAIHSAKTQIDLAAYSFTSKEVAQALVQAAQRGVQVRVVADKKDNEGSKYSAVTTMQQNQIPVRLDGHYAIMHNKFMVIDSATTETGSFNFTSSADKRNAENALVIWNEPQLAGVYEQEFERLWQESSASGNDTVSHTSSSNSVSSLRRSLSNLLTR